MLDAILSLDDSLTLAINQAYSASADTLMIIISDKKTWIPLYLGLLFLIQKVFGWKRAFFIVVFIVLNVVLTDQISVLFKESFMRLRPCHDPDLSSLLHLAHGCGGKFGFVSSHAANTIGLAVLFSLIMKHRGITIAMAAFALVNGYSRIYLGQHFLGDVLGGYLLGALIGYLVYLALQYTVKRWKIA